MMIASKEHTWNANPTVAMGCLAQVTAAALPLGERWLNTASRTPEAIAQLAVGMAMQALTAVNQTVYGTNE